MFIEINVNESDNSPLSINRIFYALGEPNKVSWVKVSGPDGKECRCNVTGWSLEGPCAAYAALVEDSGEGIVMLIYGGDQGIRLKPIDCHEPWDLNSSRQWGEACLLLDKDAELA